MPYRDRDCLSKRGSGVSNVLSETHTHSLSLSHTHTVGRIRRGVRDKRAAKLLYMSTKKKLTLTHHHMLSCCVFTLCFYSLPLVLVFLCCSVWPFFHFLQCYFLGHCFQAHSRQCISINNLGKRTNESRFKGNFDKMRRVQANY